MNEREKIADRVRKLLAMATSANENEAAAFAEKAQALLLEHNLSMTDIEANAEEPDVDMDFDTLTEPSMWAREVAGACAELYMCSYMYSDVKVRGRKTKKNQHVFIGSRANITVAKLMFAYLFSTVRRLAQEGAKKLPKKEQSPYRVSFSAACALRLSARMSKRVAEAKRGGTIVTEQGTTLPAVLDMYQKAEALQQQAKEAFASRMGVDIAKVKQKAPIDLSPRGAVEGFAAGNEIGLDQQIGADKTKRIGG